MRRSLFLRSLLSEKAASSVTFGAPKGLQFLWKKAENKVDEKGLPNNFQEKIAVASCYEGHLMTSKFWSL